MTTAPTTLQNRTAMPPSAGGSGWEPGAVTAGDIWSMIKRRMVLIVALFLVFAAATVGGFGLWWVKFPGYRSVALIECISNIPQAQLTPEQERLRQDEYDRFVLTQAQLLKSPVILSEALKLTAVRETGWWKDIQARRWKKPDQHLIELTEELAAAPIRGTNFLRVAMECHDPADPRVIVGAVVRQWYDRVKKRAADEFADSALDAARNEADALDREILDIRTELGRIAVRLPAGARQASGDTVTAQELAQYSQQVAELELELSQLEQYRAAYNDPAGLAATAEDRAAVEQDPQVAELMRAVLLLEQQRAADARIYGPDHRVLKQLDAQLEAAQRNLNERMTEKLRERRADMREMVNTGYESTRHALFLARERRERAEAALQDQDTLMFDYTRLEKELDQKEEYRTQLSEYTKGLKRVKAQRNAINASIAQEATDPLERSSPSLLLLPVGVLLSLLLSIGVGLGLELLDTSVRTSQDLTRHINVPVLGLVPDTDDEEMPIAQVETAVHDAPQSMVAEAFRRIRTNLQFALPAQSAKSLLVTSPHPEDGKTTVACNLAMAMAQAGRRVLLVDANLRRPALQKLFGDAVANGLTNLLTGEGALSSYAVSSGTPNLDVLGSGPAPPPNPAELLGSAQFRTLIEQATAEYDQVIVDSPPVLLASDAAAAGAAVDGVILVVRAKRNSRGAARRAALLVQHTGAHLCGTVLNAVQMSRGGYFREQSKAFYDYQSEARIASLPPPASQDAAAPKE